MYTYLRFGVGIVGGGIGALLGGWLLKRNHIPHDPFIDFIYIMGGAVVFGLIAGYIYGIYVLYFSGNMEHVENLVNRMKNPLYVVTRHLIRGENDKVWNMLDKVKNPSLRAYFEAQLLLEQRNIEKAEKVIDKIKIKNLRDIQLATLAVVKGEWESFNQLKNNLKPGFKYFDVGRRSL